MINQKGIDNITVDDLIGEITPKGRGDISVMFGVDRVFPGTVPAHVKAELLSRIRQFLTSH